MRSLVISACCLLLLPLGCNSAAEDPAAAAKAAKAAAGALTPPTVQDPNDNGGDGPVIGDDELPGAPGGGGPKVEAPPSVGTATCIVDDGDSGDHRDDGDDQKGPGGFKGPGGIVPIDPKVPKVEGAMAKVASPKATGDQAVARSTGADRTTAATALTVTRTDWSSICNEQMDASTCEDVCGSLTWDRSAGTNGTCFKLTSSTSSTSSSGSTAQCGCMCLPGS